MKVNVHPVPRETQLAGEYGANWFVYLLRWAKISLKHSLVSGVCSLVGAHQIFGKETRRHLTGSLQRQQNSKAIDTVLCSPVLFLFVSMLLIFPR